MSLAIEKGPAAAVAEETLPPKKGSRSKRALRREDWQTIRRVLSYAYAFRGRVILALWIGLIAGFFTSMNMMALIPLLDVMIEGRNKDKLAGIQEDINKYQKRLDEREGFWSEMEPYLDMKKNELRYAWTKWVLDQQEKAIWYMAALLVLAQVTKSLLEFCSKYLLQKSFYLAVLRLRTHLYSRCMELDLPSFQRITSGDLIARLNNDMRAVKQVFTSAIGEVVLQPFTALFLLIALLILNWQLTIIVVIGLPVIVLPITYVGKKLRMMGKKDEEEDAKILDYTQETIQGIMIVKAFTGERREMKKFRHLSREMADRQIRREKYRLYGEPFVEITASIAMAGVLCIGAYLILQSDNASMRPSEFLIYLAIMSRFYPPIKAVSSTFIKLQKALASADRIFEIIDTKPFIVEKPDAKVITPIEKQIEFRDVNFAYAADKPAVLEGFSLTIPKGRKVALVGRTGAGKSTVARLLPRFYDTNGGQILIDDLDIRDVTLKSLRGQMAVVSQETILFNDTIHNNIRYGKPLATREQVESAARSAYAHEFIERLPRGYETVIGERGGQLSGGQRQRLAIARALLADTPILILDEATSALDTESESIVQRAIEALMEHRTVIVIAHRLSTVRKADEIVVMENGRIVERGTHGSLLEQQGKYFDLVQRDELMDR